MRTFYMALLNVLSYSGLRNHLRRIFGLRSQAAIANLKITCKTSSPIHSVSPRYLSFSIDISVLAGGMWWEGSKDIKNGLGATKISPLNTSRKKLDRLTAALSPAYLRVGGSEADKIHYLKSVEGESDALVLTQGIWDDLHRFIQRNDLKLYFTVKYGLFNKSEHGDWAGNEILKLLEYSKKQQYEIDVCELGNELNAYWVFYGLSAQPRASQLAKDYSTFSKLIRSIYPNIKIAGPGSAFWPKIGETLKPVSNLSERFLRTSSCDLDIVDWHYYPFQSTRTPLRTRTASIKKFLSPNSFKDFSVYSDRLRFWRDQYQPKAQLWTGETGSAQCGGEPKISDRFISCFWWADQLGRGAQIGQRVMIRQSLIGGDYGMIDRLTLKPRPDYWVSWLWKRLMGEHVFDVKSSSRRIRAYMHAHPNGIDYTLMLINLTSQEQVPCVEGVGRLLQQYCLTAKKLRSKKVRINGRKPKIKDPDLSLEAFGGSCLQTVIAPFSVNFWVFGPDTTK